MITFVLADEFVRPHEVNARAPVAACAISERRLISLSPGSDIYLDFTGSSPQISDRPINMPFEGTVSIAVFLVLRSILLDTETHEYIPQNSGLERPIHIHAPSGSICNPTFPAPTIARFCPGNIVAI